jgi:hypothetical protein
VAEGLATRQSGLKHVSTVSTNSLAWGIAEQPLRWGIPRHNLAVGVDSEGCVGGEFNQIKGVSNHRDKNLLSANKVVREYIKASSISGSPFYDF